MLGMLVAAEPAGAQSQLPPELYSISSGMVTAHFGGEKPEGDFPLKYGVTHLWFTFAGDDQTYVFPPHDFDALHWQLESVFSPDGRYTLLLVNNAPYHVVATTRLKAYLTGAKPDYVVDGLRINSIGGVQEKAKWTSAQSFEFSFGCCASEQIMKFDIEQDKLECLRQREFTDLTKGAWKSCNRLRSPEAREGPAADD